MAVDLFDTPAKGAPFVGQGGQFHHLAHWPIELVAVVVHKHDQIAEPKVRCPLPAALVMRMMWLRMRRARLVSAAWQAADTDENPDRFSSCFCRCLTPLLATGSHGHNSRDHLRAAL
jgi:hypothetical protein